MKNGNIDYDEGMKLAKERRLLACLIQVKKVRRHRLAARTRRVTVDGGEGRQWHRFEKVQGGGIRR